MTEAKARWWRNRIELAASTMTDAEALNSIELFAEWKTDTNYIIDERRRYCGKLYKCIQSHQSQDNWTPDVAVSLWSIVSDPSIEYPDWVQPSGTHNAYMRGDKVSHTDKHWISDVDNNVWEPGVYGWNLHE